MYDWDRPDLEPPEYYSECPRCGVDVIRDGDTYHEEVDDFYHQRCWDLEVKDREDEEADSFI